MAQKLHSQYGYSYTDLKVLLGGWNTWKQENAKNPTAYPIGGTDATPGASGAGGTGQSNPAPAPALTVVVGTPAPNLAPAADTPKP